MLCDRQGCIVLSNTEFNCSVIFCRVVSSVQILTASLSFPPFSRNGTTSSQGTPGGHPCNGTPLNTLDSPRGHHRGYQCTQSTPFEMSRLGFLLYLLCKRSSQRKKHTIVTSSRLLVTSSWLLVSIIGFTNNLSVRC